MPRTLPGPVLDGVAGQHLAFAQHAASQNFPSALCTVAPGEAMLHPLARMSFPGIVPQVSPEVVNSLFSEKRMMTSAWLEHIRSLSQLCICQPCCDLVASCFEDVIHT